MRRFWSIFFVFILGIILLLHKNGPITLAVSSPDFEQAYQTYIQSSSVYQTDFEKFVLARSQYLTFKSISSESEAIAATKKMIFSRTDFVANYLKALRIKLALETNILDYQENLLYLQLDNELSSLLNSKEVVTSAQDLKELSKIEKDSGEKFKEIKKSAYKSLSLIIYHQTLKETTDLRKQVDLLKTKLGEYAGLGNSDLSNAQKRFSQLDDQLRSLEKEVAENRKNFFSQVDGQADPERAYLTYKEQMSSLNMAILNLFPSFEEIIFLIKKT